MVGALSGRATVLRSSGVPEAIRRAIGLYREEAALLRDLGREDEMPEALVGLALAYRDLATADPTAALELGEGVTACREALGRAEGTGKRDVQALAACTLADLCLVMARVDGEAYRERHLKEALAFYGQAEKLWADTDQDGLALCRLGLAEAYIALGENLEGARDLLEEVPLLPRLRRNARERTGPLPDGPGQGARGAPSRGGREAPGGSPSQKGGPGQP